MKYKVCEMMLNEYVNHPTEVLIEEIEAENQQEAKKIAEQRWPNREIEVSPSC
jgi:hypothetical protein